jgi:hypothetical protein
MRFVHNIALVSFSAVCLSMLVGCPRKPPGPPPATLGAGASYTEKQVCVSGSEIVLLVVDPSLPYRIRTDLDQFETDLCNDGYTVVERLTTFQSPVALRNWLANAYTNRNNMVVGAILIGDMPYAYQYYETHPTNPSIPVDQLETISYQYYADLNGNFSKSSGYVSPGGHTYSYDLHTGNLDWEIWIGVLPFYKKDYEATADAVIRYFQKNHAYRTAAQDPSFVFMEIDEHQQATTLQEHNQIVQSLSSGPYAWTPLSSSANALFYFKSTAAGLTVAQGYAALSEGSGDFTVAATHGSGQINTAWALSHNINTDFFWSDGCAVADLDDLDNFITAVLYSPYSNVVVARGSTQNSGGLGTNSNGFYGHNIATALSMGSNIGDAILYHVNVPLIWPWSTDREFHFSPNIVLGDPTLGI